jgi:hypothetical protein
MEKTRLKNNLVYISQHITSKIISKIKTLSSFNPKKIIYGFIFHLKTNNKKNRLFY